MIIFLYGQDDYRRVQKKKEIIGEFKKKYSDLGLSSFDLAVPEALVELQEFLRGQSIFENKKLAVIENLFPARKSSMGEGEQEAEKTPKGLSEAIALIKKYSETKNITILISEPKKPIKAYAFLLKTPVLAQEFEVLTGIVWDAFIKTEAKRQGVTLGAQSARFLAQVFEGNSWGLATELQRLTSYEGTVEIEDLNNLDLDIAPNYWALMNGVKGFDMRTRLGALERLLEMSDPAPKLFNILASQWREKTIQMAAYDRAIKAGRMEYEEALVDLVL